MNSKKTILIIDNDTINISVLAQLLIEKYTILVAKSGEEGVEIALTKKPDLILLDLNAPKMGSYEVLEVLKSSFLTSEIPVIIISSKESSLDEAKFLSMGANDYIRKPVSYIILNRRIEVQLKTGEYLNSIKKEINEKNKEVEKRLNRIITTLGITAEYKDDDTQMHVIRMSNYAQLIGLEYGLNREYANLLLTVAPMHDIGKIGIPYEIMEKSSSLTKEEWDIMKRHPFIGGKIIGDSNSIILKLSRIVSEQHHENWDGTGYPLGLKRDEIHIFARIVTVADVFDALVSKRPYKKPWSVEDSVSYIQSLSGKNFDPLVVDAFTRALPEILKKFEEYKEVSSQCF